MDGTVQDLINQIRCLPVSSDSTALVDQLRALEELKAAAAAAQARVAVAFDRAQRAEQAEAGIPAAEQGQGVAAQVAWPGVSRRPGAGGCSGWPWRW